MPPINDWVNVAAVRSELPVIRPKTGEGQKTYPRVADHVVTADRVPS